MGRRLVAAAAALLLLPALACTLSGLAPPGAALAEEGEIAGVEWLTDLDEARAAARASGKPILAVFT